MYSLDKTLGLDSAQWIDRSPDGPKSPRTERSYGAPGTEAKGGSGNLVIERSGSELC